MDRTGRPSCTHTCSTDGPRERRGKHSRCCLLSDWQHLSSSKHTRRTPYWPQDVYACVARVGRRVLREGTMHCAIHPGHALGAKQLKSMSLMYSALYHKDASTAWHQLRSYGKTSLHPVSHLQLTMTSDHGIYPSHMIHDNNARVRTCPLLSPVRSPSGNNTACRVNDV